MQIICYKHSSIVLKTVKVNFTALEPKQTIELSIDGYISGSLYVSIGPDYKIYKNTNSLTIDIFYSKNETVDVPIIYMVSNICGIVNYDLNGDIFDAYMTVSNNSRDKYLDVDIYIGITQLDYDGEIVKSIYVDTVPILFPNMVFDLLDIVEKKDVYNVNLDHMVGSHYSTVEIKGVECDAPDGIYTMNGKIDEDDIFYHGSLDRIRIGNNEDDNLSNGELTDMISSLKEDGISQLYWPKAVLDEYKIRSEPSIYDRHTGVILMPQDE